MKSTLLKPEAEGHAARIYWPKPARDEHAQTGARQPVGCGERKDFVYKWGHV